MARPQTQTTRTYSNSPSHRVIEGNQAPAMDATMRERIARRAYEIYLGRGGTNGDETQDWLQAERELRLGRL
ncbi:MAG: DUF2934 domain-containing protein [Myxococcaceae bacterium]